MNASSRDRNPVTLLRRVVVLLSLSSLLVLTGCEPRLANSGGEDLEPLQSETEFPTPSGENGGGTREVDLGLGTAVDGVDVAEATLVGSIGGTSEPDAPGQFPMRRDITSEDGRRISGEIVAKKGTDIAFRRDSDGQIFVLSLFRLSVDDQLDLAGLVDESVETVAELREATAEAAHATAAATTQPLRRRRASWHEDPEEAFAEAASTGLPLYVLFTGSDWCPPCKALEKNIHKKRDFQEFADENLVLLKLDFPRRKAQSASIKERNNALAGQWGVTAFPSIFVLDDPDSPKTLFSGSRRTAKEHIESLASQLQ